MSSTTKWAVAVVVIAVAAWAMWQAGWLGGGAASDASDQSAAAANAVSPADAIAQNSAAIDAYLQANTKDLADLGKTLSLSAESAVAASLGAAGSLMTSIATSLATTIADAKKAGKPVDALQAAFNDMGVQIGTASAIVVSASKDIKALNPAKGTANNSVLQRTLPRLQSAQSYLEAARADIKKIVDGSK